MKAKFYRQFYFFSVYFFISLFAFTLRPKAYEEGDDDDAAHNKTNTQADNNSNDTTNAPVKSLFLHNLTEIFCNYSAYQEALIQDDMSNIMINSSSIDNSTLPIDDSDEWTSFSECPLLDISTLENRVNFF